MTESKNIIQNIILENREKISISGITEVKNFDDEIINLDTILGELTIKGKELHISKMSVDAGDITINGNIYGLVYNENTKTSFWSKLFK